jgi:Protein of unknown function (DUF2867)
VAAADDFRALPLRCHTLLADVPIHDVWVIELPGGGPGRTMRDVDTLTATGRLASQPRAARALFALRFAVGRALRWDTPRPDALVVSYLNRLSDDDRARSLVTPGTIRGPFRVLYLFPDESLAEAHNATVHGFLAMALVARDGGYTLYWAIYVKPGGLKTRLYMALIDPFRRWIVYPAMIREMRAAWARTYAAVKE